MSSIPNYSETSVFAPNYSEAYLETVFCIFCGRFLTIFYDFFFVSPKYTEFSNS